MQSHTEGLGQSHEQGLQFPRHPDARSHRRASVTGLGGSASEGVRGWGWGVSRREGVSPLASFQVSQPSPRTDTTESARLWRREA